MALDKLVDSTQLDADLTSVANAIRTKGGTSAQLAFPAGFVSAVQAISGGGGIQMKSGSLEVESDYTYTRNATQSYTGTILVDTGLSEIEIIFVWTENYERRAFTEFTKPYFAWAMFAKGIRTGSNNAVPAYYGFASAAVANSSNNYAWNGTQGVLLNATTSSIPKGKFGIKTADANTPIRAGQELKWVAYGT